MTWNLWSSPTDRAQRAQPIAATVEQHRPDVLAIQEAWTSPDATRAHDGNVAADPVTALARLLGHHRVAHHDPDAPGRGLGLCSRWPITDPRVLALPAGDAPAEHRAALTGVLDTPAGGLPVYVTHLNWRLDHGRIRRAQLRHILTDIDARHHDGPLPAVICGDLNADADAEEIRMLTGLAHPDPPGLVLHDAWTASGLTGPGHTWTHANPYAAHERLGNARLDYVFVVWRPGARAPVTGARVIPGVEDGVWASDHSAVLAHLELHAS